MNAPLNKRWYSKLLAGGGAPVRTAIGCELSLHSLNMVQLGRDKANQIRLHEWASLPFNQERSALLNDASELKALFREMMQQTRFSGNAVNAMLPASELKILSVNYELKEGDNLDKVVTDIVSERMESDLSEFVVDYLPVRRREKYGRGLAVVAVAQQQKVTHFLDTLYSAGLEVQSLDIGPAAIKRLVSTIQGTNYGETVLVVNFGIENSYLSIISGRRLLFDEQISFGEERLLAQIAEALDLNPEQVAKQILKCGIGARTSGMVDENKREISDALAQILRPSFRMLADNLQRAMAYAVAETRGEPIAQIYLVGGVARWRGASELLEHLLELPVRVLPDPLTCFGTGSDGERFETSVGRPELALATGLALRDFTDG